MKKKILFGILFLIVVVGAILGWQYQKNQKTEYSSVNVARGEIIQDVFATGTVVPSKVLDLSFETQGKIQNISVNVGDNIEEGAVLIFLDDKDYDIQILEAQASLSSALANLKKVESGVLQEDIDVAKITLANAEKNLEQVHLSVEADVKNAEQSLLSTQVTLSNAVNNLADVKKDAENDLQNAYDDAKSSFDGIYWDAFDAIDSLNEILINTLFTNFCVYDSQLKINIETQKSLADIALENLETELSVVKKSSDMGIIDNSLVLFKEKISVINVSLNLMAEGLTKSDTSSTFSQTSLNTYKTNISADISSINSDASSLDANIQTIKNVKLTNEINVNTAQRSVSASESSVASAEQTLSSTKIKANGQIVSAENQVELAKKQLLLKEAGVQDYELELARAQVNQAEASLAKINNSRQKTIILSPIKGVVTNVLKEVGENAVVGEKVISVITYSQYQVEADISESDIAKIKIADSVKTTFDAFGPDKFWTGKVVKIDPAERIIQGVVYYRITVDLGELNKVKSGMTANLTILTDKKENVLYIPSRAILRKEGVESVRILGKDGFIEERKVVSGLKGSEGDVEIIEGISEGDVIVISIKE